VKPAKPPTSRRVFNSRQPKNSITPKELPREVRLSGGG
jgi:hypothetical protein